MRRRSSRTLAALTLLGLAALPASVVAHGEKSAREAEVTVEEKRIEVAVLFALHDLDGTVDFDIDGDPDRRRDRDDSHRDACSR